MSAEVKGPHGGAVSGVDKDVMQILGGASQSVKLGCPYSGRRCLP
jgi:hypothetical protein